MKKFLLVLLALLITSDIFSQAGFPPKAPPHDFSRGDGKMLRGKKDYPFEDVFQVRFVTVGKIENGKIPVFIGFSQSIKPASVSLNKLQINEKDVPADTEISFSRNGGILRIVTDAPEGPFSLIVKEIESSKDLKITKITIKGLCEDYRKRF